MNKPTPPPLSEEDKHTLEEDVGRLAEPLSEILGLLAAAFSMLSSEEPRACEATPYQCATCGFDDSVVYRVSSESFTEYFCVSFEVELEHLDSPHPVVTHARILHWEGGDVYVRHAADVNALQRLLPHTDWA